MQEKHKFMNAQSKKILNKSRMAGAARDISNNNSQRGRSRGIGRSQELINSDINEVFSLRDEEFANMGYVDSMKMQEM